MAAKPSETQIHLRIEDDVVELIDWYIEDTKATSGIELSRPNAVRALTIRMVTWLKAERGKEKRK